MDVLKSCFNLLSSKAIALVRRLGKSPKGADTDYKWMASYIPEDEIPSESKAYEKIQSLVPEIASYKKATFIHVRDVAKQRGFDNLKAYADALATDQGEVEYLKRNLTLKGSHFFRGDDWDYLNKQCLSTFAGRDTVSVWCAGCSSGEEVYSVIMSLMDYVPLEGIRVLATDYNEEQLEKCRVGSYFNMHYEEIPEGYRHYVVMLDDGKRFTFPQEMKDVMSVRQLNLLTDEYPGPFDLVICRNVIKFFSLDMIPQVQRKLAETVAPGGYLFLSTDDKTKGIELIPNPKSLGMELVSLRGIYRKVV